MMKQENRSPAEAVSQFGEAIRKMRYDFMMTRLVRAADDADREWEKILRCGYSDPLGEVLRLRRR